MSEQQHAMPSSNIPAKSPINIPADTPAEAHKGETPADAQEGETHASNDQQNGEEAAAPEGTSVAIQQAELILTVIADQKGPKAEAIGSGADDPVEGITRDVIGKHTCSHTFRQLAHNAAEDQFDTEDELEHARETPVIFGPPVDKMNRFMEITRQHKVAAPPVSYTHLTLPTKRIV